MQVLNGYDVVLVQHEYGIFGGPDGSDVLDLLDALTVPVIVVLHTVLADPTARQRRHPAATARRPADAVVTMTETARAAADRGYGVGPRAGHRDPARRRRTTAVRVRPRAAPTARSS